MVKEIRMEEGKLKVIFEIRDNGVVELKQFDPAGRADVRERKREAEEFLSDHRSTDDRTGQPRDACV